MPTATAAATFPDFEANFDKTHSNSFVLYIEIPYSILFSINNA